MHDVACEFECSKDAQNQLVRTFLKGMPENITSTLLQDVRYHIQKIRAAWVGVSEHHIKLTL